MLRRKRKRTRRRGSAFFCRRKTKRGTGTSRNVAAVVSPGKSDGILTGRPLVDLVPSSLSPFLLPRKRVESASHILENCWGHLTSWPNMFPRIGGTWVRATLSGSVSISLSRRLCPFSRPLRCRVFLSPSLSPVSLFPFFFFRRSFTSLNCPFSAAAIIRQCVSTRPRKRREWILFGLTFFFSPLFNSRERKRGTFSRKSFFE